MRHAAITLAEQAAHLVDQGAKFDLIFCTDMINLAELKGLLPPLLQQVPTLLYFHENQLTYPDPNSSEKDFHFGFTNIVSGIAADAIWFNSEFHRRVFLDAAAAFVRRMPDCEPTRPVAQLETRAAIQSPGIEPLNPPPKRIPGPLRILWAARWEHDKNPALFLQAMERLRKADTPFRLNVIGQTFESQPEVFEQIREKLADHIDHWGFIESRREYEQILAESDVFVSTANHEFFGIAAVEAIAAGCIPLLPNRLAYPELLVDLSETERAFCLYDGSSEQLTERLKQLAEVKTNDINLPLNAARLSEIMRRFSWSRRASEMDAALEFLQR